MDTLEFLGSFEAHRFEITAIETVGDEFVWTAAGNEVIVWRVEGTVISNTKLLELQSACTLLYFSPLENRVWSCTKENILVWDTKVSDS